MEIIKCSVFTIITLILLGVLSLRKPSIVGADLYLSKYKWLYIPRFKKTTNKYYEHQIKVIGIGLIISAALILTFMIIYIIYPPIISLF